MAAEVVHFFKTFIADGAIEQYRLVRLSAGSGTNVVQAGAEDEPIGIAYQDDVALGETVNVRLLNAPGSVKLSAAGAFAIRDRLYPAADGQVDDTPASAGKSIGIALVAATAANDIVECLLDGVEGSKLDGLLHAEIANSAALTNDGTETVLAGKTIRGADLQIGDILRVKAVVVATATNAADTLDVTVRLGGTDIVATGAVDPANDDVFQVESDIVIRAVGAGGAVQGYGKSAAGAGGTATFRARNLTNTAINLAGDVELDVTGDWSVANAGNSCRLEGFTVEHLRQ